MPQSFLRRSIVSGQFACLGRQTVCCFPYLPFQETASSAGTAFIHSTRTTYSLSSSSLDRQYSPDSGSEKNGVPLIFTDAAGAADALTMQQPTKPHPGIFTQTRSPGESSKADANSNAHRLQRESHTSAHHPKTAAFARQGLHLWPRRSSRSILRSILSFPRPISFRNRRRLYGLRIVRGGLRRSGIKHRCVPLLQAAQE